MVFLAPDEANAVRGHFRVTLEFLAFQKFKGWFFKGHRLRFIREVQKKAEPFGPIGSYHRLNLRRNICPRREWVFNREGI